MRLSVIAVASVSVLLSACSSVPQNTESEKPMATAPKASMETDAQRMERIVRTLAGQSIYFGYDDFSIKPEYRSKLKQAFELLNSAPQLAIRLEGNADERGSTEYNLALGQKRAEAVRRTLMLLGVPEARLEAVSYGKERPRADCHEETCWAQNRRVDLGEKKI
jgi:peptidoglycan-associated lipoprotein